MSLPIEKVYEVVVEVTGTKAYKIIAKNEEEVKLMFLQHGTFDTYHNPFWNDTYEEIIDVTERPIGE